MKIAPTHTKQIENLYGTEDMLLTRFGVQAFGKSQDDIIKYSADLLDTSHKWRTRKMKEIVKQLDQTQYVFTKEQQELLDAGVTPAEVIHGRLHSSRVVELCRKSHNGLI